MKRIIGVAEVPCSVCGAAAYEICSNTPKPPWCGPRQDNIWHAERVFDACDATRAMNALLGEDDERS